MSEGKLVVLDLNETKVKGTGECNFKDTVGRMPGVVNGRAREGVTLLLSKLVLDG